MGVTLASWSIDDVMCVFSAWPAALGQWHDADSGAHRTVWGRGAARTPTDQPPAPPGALPIGSGDKNTDTGHAEEWKQPRSMCHLFIQSVFILNVCFWNSLLNMTFSKFNSHNIYSEFCANIFWLWASCSLFHVNNLQICITTKPQPLHLLPLKTLVLFDGD